MKKDSGSYTMFLLSLKKNLHGANWPRWVGETFKVPMSWEFLANPKMTWKSTLTQIGEVLGCEHIEAIDLFQTNQKPYIIVIDSNLTFMFCFDVFCITLSKIDQIRCGMEMKSTT